MRGLVIAAVLGASTGAVAAAAVFALVSGGLDAWYAVIDWRDMRRERNAR